MFGSPFGMSGASPRTLWQAEDRISTRSVSSRETASTRERVQQEFVVANMLESSGSVGKGASSSAQPGQSSAAGDVSVVQRQSRCELDLLHGEGRGDVAQLDF